MADKQRPGYIFPNIPQKWTQEERNFALALRQLFDNLFVMTRGLGSNYDKDSYESLKDKPSINYTTLKGNRSLSDIGIHSASADSAGLMSAAHFTKLDGITTASDDNEGLMPAAMYTKLDGITTASADNEGLMPAAMFTKLDDIGDVSADGAGLMTVALFTKLAGIEDEATKTTETRPEVDYLSMMTGIPIPTDTSDKVEKVSGYYDDEIWNKEMVWDAVDKSWITAQDYEDITGEPFPPFRPN